MTIVRAPLDPNSGFTVVPNSVLNDDKLSWKARGLLIYLLSKPPLWRTSAARLSNDGPDGRDAIRSGLLELQHAGYVVRGRYQDKSTGRWTTISTVYDRPLPGRPWLCSTCGQHCGQTCGQPVDNSATEDGFSGVGKPGSLVSTERVNTESVVTSLVTTRGHCRSCSGTGVIHYAGQVEDCPECQAARA